MKNNRCKGKYWVQPVLQEIVADQQHKNKKMKTPKTQKNDSTRCRRCHRKLSGAKSVAKGIGLVCLKREPAEAGKKREARYKGAIWEQLGLFDQLRVEP